MSDTNKSIKPELDHHEIHLQTKHDYNISESINKINP